MHRDLGFTFLEIMISLLILSFMLLGLDALQIETMKAEEASFDLSVATRQIQNMVERLQVIGEDDVSEQMLAWNKENQLVLPQGVGRVKGLYPNYKIAIFWGAKVGDECLVNHMGTSGCLHYDLHL